jgi:hypothetical protein
LQQAAVEPADQLDRRWLADDRRRSDTRSMIIDTTAAAWRADDQRGREWQANQRVFISSALADTDAERRAVAETVAELGATPVWFRGRKLGGAITRSAASLSACSSPRVRHPRMEPLWSPVVATDRNQRQID